MRSVQGLRSFKDTLPAKVRGIIKKKGHIYSELLDNWRIIVGDDLFKICYPKSFKSENKVRGSLLEIMVKRGHEVDMEYSKKQVVDKVNNFFNENVLKNIKLITFEGYNEKFEVKIKKKATNSEYTKKISDIKNDKIKNSLLEMIKHFKKI
tara:strand:+ start:139 stop:591 length:453 start_codon:yes stop_codon:yes gene_type:complete